MPRCAFVVLALLLVAPAVLAAQTPAPLLQADARVRVRLLPEPGGWTVGRIRAVTPDSLLLREAAVTSVPLSGVDRLEVSRGRARGRWVLLGTGVGMVAGIVYSRATLEDSPAGGVQNAADGLANTILGMLMGGAAGYFLAPERWTHVPLAGAR